MVNLKRASELKKSRAYIVLEHKFLADVLYDLLKNEGPLTTNEIKNYISLGSFVTEKCLWGCLYGNKNAFIKDENTKKWFAISRNFVPYVKKN